MGNQIIFDPVIKILEKKEKKRIKEYSAKNKKVKETEENSVLNPLTNSDSPSVRSKGARLVSAKIIVIIIGKKKIMRKKFGKNWLYLTSLKEKENLREKGQRKKKEKATS